MTSSASTRPSAARTCTRSIAVTGVEEAADELARLVDRHRVRIVIVGAGQFAKRAWARAWGSQGKGGSRGILRAAHASPGPGASSISQRNLCLDRGFTVGRQGEDRQRPQHGIDRTRERDTRFAQHPFAARRVVRTPDRHVRREVELASQKRRQRPRYSRSCSSTSASRPRVTPRCTHCHA